MISVEQIRGARVMLGLDQKTLAGKAGISVATLNNIERGAQKDPKISTIRAIRSALEAEGIEFITTPLGGIGVCLKQRHAVRGIPVILIVDDCKTDRVLYRNWLARAPDRNYRIIEAEDAAGGLDTFIENDPDCIILDFMMYGADGFQLLAALKREHARIPPIIFVTGMHSDLVEENARSYGVHKYLNKQSLDKQGLRQAVDEALEGRGHGM